MAKKMKKKKKLKILPILVFLLILFFAFILIKCLLNSKIKNIYIYDNKLLSDQEIIELAKLEEYPSFLKTSSSSIKNKIIKSPVVEDVKIKKKFFNQVHIYIKEKVVLFQTKDKKIVLNDKSELEYKEFIGVPILLNYIPDTIYNDFIKEMSNIKEKIRRQISEIEYSPNNYDEARFLLYMNDGNYVYLTLTKFDSLNYYNDVYATLGGKKGILYLDSGNHFKIME